jgi:hypothetical protein
MTIPRRRPRVHLPNAVAHQRERGSEPAKRHRERLRLYGRPGAGYRVTQRVIPNDVADSFELCRCKR